jgi:hypothetical protein
MAAERVRRQLKRAVRLQLNHVVAAQLKDVEQ